MQQPPSGQNWPPQGQPYYGNGQLSQPMPPNTQWGQQPYPPQQGQWQQPPSQSLPQNTQWGQQPYLPQQEQWQQPYRQPPLGPDWQPQQPSKKSRKGFWLTLVVFAALIVFACIGVNMAISATSQMAIKNASTMINNTQSTVNTSLTQVATLQPTITPTTLPTPTPTVASGPAKVGQTITADGLSCTLLSVKTIRDDGLGQLKAGNEWVVVTVKLVNQSGQSYDYTWDNFSIVSGTGNATSPDVPPQTYTANNGMDIAGTLIDGGSTTGDLVFQAPIGDHKAELAWNPNVLDNTLDNVWSLGL